MCHASCKTVDVKKKAKEEKWHNFLPTVPLLYHRSPSDDLDKLSTLQSLLSRCWWELRWHRKEQEEKKSACGGNRRVHGMHGASLPQLTKKCKVQLHRRNPEVLLVFGKSFKILGVTWGISAHCFLKMLHVKIKVIINCYSIHCRIYQGCQSSVAGTCLLRNVTCAQVTSLGGFSCPLTTSTTRHEDFPKAKVTQ